MKSIWIVKTGESLPIDGENVRLFRAGLIAQFLSAKGYKITWWNADFDHQNKKKRNCQTDSFFLNEHLEVILLKSCGYQKSISLKRIIDHIQLAQDFKEKSKQLQKPDIIFCAFPAIDLASKVVAYGNQNNVPVIVDIRDLWPDIFMERLFPSLPTSFGKLLTYPFSRKVRKLLNMADGVTSVSPPMLQWGVNQMEISKKSYNKVFPFAYFRKETTEEEYQKAYKKLEVFGMFEEKPKIRVCLFATLNNSFDIETIIEAAHSFDKSQIQFILCGKGERLKDYKLLAENLDNVFFPGWVYDTEIKTILKHSDIGLAPYIDSVGFKYNLTNKPIEYMSVGLPVLTCVNGYLKTLIEENKCGFYYEVKSSKSLIKTLEKLLKEPETLREYKKNALQLFEENFKGEVIYNKLTDYFNLIIKSYKDGSRSNN